MNLSPEVAARLVELGHDAIHVLDLGAGAEPDDRVAELARVENRHLVTTDLDFGDLLALTESDRPSVIVIRLRDPRPDTVIRRLRTVLATCGEALATGA